MYSATAKCPYCGHVQPIRVEARAQIPELVYCDVEQGGCDNFFIATATVRIDVAVSVEGIPSQHAHYLAAKEPA